MDALRRALREEIGEIDYLDDLAEEYALGHSRIESLVPKYVYEAQTSNLGKLTERERDLVVTFYSRTHELENLLRIQRNEDLPSNYFWGVFHLGERIVDTVLKTISLGLYTPPRDKRARTIQARFKKVARAQKEAVAALEGNLPEFDDPRGPVKMDERRQ